MDCLCKFLRGVYVLRNNASSRYRPYGSVYTNRNNSINRLVNTRLSSSGRWSCTKGAGSRTVERLRLEGVKTVTEYKSINVKDKTHARLRELGRMNESFDDLINRIIEGYIAFYQGE